MLALRMDSHNRVELGPSPPFLIVKLFLNISYELNIVRKCRDVNLKHSDFLVLTNNNHDDTIQIVKNILKKFNEKEVDVT